MKIFDKNEILFFTENCRFSKNTNKSSNTYDLSMSKFEKGGNLIVTAYSLSLSKKLIYENYENYESLKS